MSAKAESTIVANAESWGKRIAIQLEDFHNVSSRLWTLPSHCTPFAPGAAHLAVPPAQVWPSQGREETRWELQWRAALLFSIPTHFMRCFRGNCVCSTIRIENQRWHDRRKTSLEPHQLHDAPGLRTSCWGRLKQMRPCLGEHRMQRGKHMRGHRHAIDIFDELNVSVLAYKQAVHLYMMLTNWIRL